MERLGHLVMPVLLSACLIRLSETSTTLRWMGDGGVDLATEKLLNAYQKLLQNPSAAKSLSDFTDELSSSVMQILRTVPPALVTKEVQMQTKLASMNEDLPNADDETCSRDYSSMCPDGWVDKGDGKTCVSPSMYTGECGKEENLSNKTPIDKKQFAVSCNVNWPCIDKCNEDYNFRCPSGWTELGGGDCQAPDSYKGRCVRRKNFSNYGAYAKEEWSISCKVKWPCTQRDMDLSTQVCPIDWTEQEDDTCKAPEHYVGPCDLAIPIGNMANSEKLELTTKCKLAWPIDATMAFDFTQPCPVGWKQLARKLSSCMAPPEYKGPCEQIQSFDGATDEAKYTWSQKCGVQWGFKGETETDMNSAGAECPSGWKLEDIRSGICSAPGSYEGPCETRFSFLGYSPRMKIAWAQTCQARFQVKGLSTTVGKLLHTEPSGGTNLRTGVDGPIGPPLSKFYGHVLPAKGIVYMESGTHNRSDMPPIVPDRSASGAAATKRHIAEMRELQEKAHDPKLSQAIDDGIKQLELQGGSVPLEFRFTQAGIFGYYRHNERAKAQEEMNAATDTMDGGVIELPGKLCLRDYTVCPVGWQNLDNTRCLAPDSYRSSGGKCSPVFALGNMVTEVSLGWYRGRILAPNTPALQQWATDCGAEFPCRVVNHDYVSSPCPSGWEHIGDGSCSAPQDYPTELKQRCGSVVSFKYASPEFRRSWAKICAADWPTFSECEADYSDPCPLGFKRMRNPAGVPSGTNVCTSKTWRSFIEDEICRNPLHVPDSPYDKKNIALQCGVSWKCTDKCEMSFWQKCPYGWVYEGSKCTAPPEYVPPPGCDSTFKVSFFSLDSSLEKRAHRCHTPWPCKGDCQSDWTHPCPSKWKVDEDIMSGTVMCKANNSYDGPCEGRPFDLTGYSFAQKQDFAFRCEVKWQCGGTKRILHTTFNINKGWQKAKSYKDSNWNNLGASRFIEAPPILPEEHKVLPPEVTETETK